MTSNDKIEGIPCMRVGGPGRNSLWQGGDADGACVRVYSRGVVALHTWSFTSPKLEIPVYAVSR